ncbi:MAG: thioredoxin [Candidatus Riflebacteria bacterium]|nr:thioredoxin [Candidatus Riflebacteria bacterium]
MDDLTSEAFQAGARNPEAVALVVFYAAWCAPSRLQVPVIDRLAEEFRGRVFVGQVNVDTEEALAEEFGARTLPTTVLLAGGEVVEILAGYQQEEFLRSYLDQILQSVAESDPAAPPGSS